MANERLHSTMTAAGHRYETVAGELDVDPKTVERWVTLGRKPHRVHRWKLAQLLGRDEAYLWPEVLKDPQTQSASEAEFVHLYPSRGSVPRELWRSLFEQARESVDVPAYAGLFIVDNEPDIVDVIKAKAAGGVRVRILIGDPESEAVDLRGDEEGIGAGMAERVRIVLGHLAPALDAPGVELRQHSTTLYNSIYRSDGTMLANTHVYGSPAGANPVIHLQRVAGGRIFSTAIRPASSACGTALP